MWRAIAPPGRCAKSPDPNSNQNARTTVLPSRVQGRIAGADCRSVCGADCRNRSDVARVARLCPLNFSSFQRPQLGRELREPETLTAIQ